MPAADTPDYTVPVNEGHNPHDAHLRVGWRLCRFGLAATADPQARARVLAWLARMEGVVPGSPHLRAWQGVLNGEAPEMVADLTRASDFFDLPPVRQGVWRPLVQSQPFSCLLPGRTTRERRTVLSRLP